jgi:TrkA-C domain
MLALATLLVVVLVSLLVTRVATVILVLTGLSRESARFQARSALSGVGFTTAEAESVITHPVRRRVIATLMLLGSAGLVTAVATLVLSLGEVEGHERLGRVAALVAGLAALLLLARSEWIDRRLSAAIEWALRRWTDLDVRDYASLLHLSWGYTVNELEVHEGDWVAGRTLGELHLRDEGLAVVGVHRGDGVYVGTPCGRTSVHPQDRLVLYGRRERLQELDTRRAGPEGDAAHERAIAEHAALGDEEAHAAPATP